MDNTGPFALKFGAILAAVAGLYNVIASFIVRATGNVLPLIGYGRGNSSLNTDPNRYFESGLVFIVLAPIVWFVANKLDE
ncbi:hypothetical protein IQ258_29390 [Coleofasciculus sp. LEGE 07081]|uniref:hypothetical protein n=1 Tax=Coleofasciculus sp. LEGE 07081 TaxID=2777967 RepID=UPI0018805E5A|nr:hypothetical protein [Coleofasciculus sp. LEGE 07081]MBE9130134.1 hypothetical protein [Coleofasciculus sp. LEGE 07081]